MNFFTYNGQSSADFGMHIESKNIFSAPAFDVTFQAIPGRNGDLIIPNNRFANASVSYTAFVAHRTIQSLADTPYIVAGGRKGGSNIAACICNALLLGT